MEKKTFREVVVIHHGRSLNLLLTIRTEVNRDRTGSQSTIDRKSRDPPLLRPGSASRRWSSVELSLVMLVALVSMAAEAEIRQSSPCRAVVDGFVYNLGPLMRVDGHPRFTVEADSGLWNYSYNPCRSFNLPLDPHEGQGDQCHYVAICQWCRNGGHFSLGLHRNARFTFYRSPSARLPSNSSSMFLPEFSKSESHRTRSNYSENANRTSHSLGGAQTTVTTSKVDSTDDGRLSGTPSPSPGTGNAHLKEVHRKQTGKGVQSSAVKSSQLDNESGSTGDVPDNAVEHNHTATNTSKKTPAIVFKGIRSKARHKVTVGLICDFKRVSADDGLFLLISDSSDNKHFELHHKCCCPNGCPEDTLPGHSPGGVGNDVRHVTSTLASESEAHQLHPTRGVGEAE